MATEASPVNINEARTADGGLAAVRELVDDRAAWPLARYEAESGIDWLRVGYVWLMVALAFVEVVLAFRLGFLIAAANAGNGFVDMIYDITGPLTSPFNGIVKASKVGAGTFEPSILVAMLSYVVGAVLLSSIAWAIDATNHEAVASRRRGLHSA